MIWSKLYIDILVLYAPGVFAIVLSHWIPNNPESAALLLFSFVAAGFLDSGHVYTTLWRTYFRSSERKRTRVYLLAPPFFFILFFTWSYMQWSYLAAFVVYATVFHNVRQLLGISRWYQKLNRNWSRLSDIFLYLGCGLPFLIFHFRQGLLFTSYYGPDELFLFPNEQIYRTLVVVYGILCGLWLSFEAYRLYSFQDFNRTLSVFFAGLFYGCAFIKGETVAQILFPLVVSHGFSYLALMILSLRRLEPLRFKGWMPIAIVAVTALIFGGAEYWVEEEWMAINSSAKALTTAILLTPLFCHYAFDAFLWKRSHPDSPQIYA